MARVTLKTLRAWITWSMLLVLVVSLSIWFLRRDRLPWSLRLASGEEGGLYFALGEELRDSLKERTGRQVKLLVTPGSTENYRLLQEGDADLAIIQGGAVPLGRLSVVTPLYPEVVLVIVRKDRGIQTMADLVGKNVALGKVGSGMRESALNVLKHFEIDPAALGHNALYFKRLLDEPALDAAIVTTGIENRDLNAVLETNEFELLPIYDAEALEMRDPYFRYMEVPRGLFSERPSVPSQPIASLATTAYLVVRTDAPDRLVSAALASIHEENLRLKVPTLIARHDAPKWVATRLHPVAQRYFNPSDDIGLLANVMESLAAGKELLFALGAGIYLFWHRWRSLKEKENQEFISRQKEHLDSFLQETLRIEAAQMNMTDVTRLQAFLDEVTRIKLKALRQFTEEELRGDQSFAIFLAQCANLISKIQLKIVAQQSRAASEESM